MGAGAAAFWRTCILGLKPIQLWWRGMLPASYHYACPSYLQPLLAPATLYRPQHTGLAHLGRSWDVIMVHGAVSVRTARRNADAARYAYRYAIWQTAHI